MEDEDPPEFASSGTPLELIVQQLDYFGDQLVREITAEEGVTLRYVQGNWLYSLIYKRTFRCGQEGVSVRPLPVSSERRLSSRIVFRAFRNKQTNANHRFIKTGIPDTRN